MSKTTLVSILFLVAVLGLVVYSTLDLQGFSCEVCMTYNGRTNCARASGTTRGSAVITPSTSVRINSMLLQRSGNAITGPLGGVVQWFTGFSS